VIAQVDHEEGIVPGALGESGQRSPIGDLDEHPMCLCSLVSLIIAAFLMDQAHSRRTDC
jgi:hypothetical protein